MRMYSHKMKYEYLIARDVVLKRAYTNLHELPKLQSMMLYMPTYHFTHPTYTQQNQCNPVWLHVITGQRPKLILKEKGTGKHTHSGLHGFQLMLRQGTHTMLNFINRLSSGVHTSSDTQSIRQQLLQQYKAVHAVHRLQSNHTKSLTRAQYVHTLNFALPDGDTRLHVTLTVSSKKKKKRDVCDVCIREVYLSALL